MSQELEDWACAQLDGLGLPDASEIIQYLQPLNKPKFVEEYLNSMLDISQPTHQEFIKEFLKRQAESKVDKRFYRKSDLPEEAASVQGKKRGKAASQGSNVNVTVKEKDKKVNKKGSINDKENKSDNDNKRSSPPSVGSGPLQQTQNAGKKKGRVSPPPAVANVAVQPSQNQNQSKKKTKFTNLYSEEGSSRDIVLLSGRYVCECLASKHKLINNCLACGRIVCEQEGSGPCFFCGNLVQTKDEREGNVTTSTVAEKSSKSKQISVKDVAEDIRKAVDHKNKLLEYDKTSEKRTKVLDDESDYFNSTSRWLSKSDREKLQARERELKLKQYDRSNDNKLTIDLLGRKIIVDEKNDAGIYDPDDPVVKSILEKEPDDLFATYERTNQHPPEVLQRPVYINTSDKNSRNGNHGLKFPSGVGNSMNCLQDSQLQEMSDQGKCMSMHQPWATLLITGIKIHEGRTWYSAHRGRLWIASAAKVVEREEISNTEEFYRLRHTGSDNLLLPQHYPAGCLLGCVDVLDVLPQEEYRLQFPEGESDSAYVFICSNPQEMIFKFPMKGQHKIFQLDNKIHQAAKKALK